MMPDDLRRDPDCPALDALLDAGNEEAKSHLAGCPACRAELALFRSFESPRPGNTEAADLDWIAARLKKARPGLPARRSWWSLLGTPKLALTAASIILVAAIAVQWNARRMTPLDQGGANVENLRSAGSMEWVEAPGGDIQSDEAPRRLQWTSLGGATYYAELVEVDGTVAWKSGPLAGNSLELPEEARRRMEPRRRFVLRVTAVDRNGKVMGITPDASFRLVPSAKPPTQ